MKLPLPLEPLTCSVSNFNYICLITSMKLPLPLPLLSRGPQTRMPNSRRRLIEAWSVFDEMANKGSGFMECNTTGYSQEGNHGLEAIFVFIEMVGEGMGLDHVSFTSAVSACGHEMNLELGKQIDGLTIKAGYGSHVSVL
ncbi:pentatricopeptide repeat-containing protein [Prunus yedoensis var. nudiflora]|uniref:Pentatricopeptide repeat-containing protein n=1 Tax=Prunus yedoensis var. nudiflora TaxID=2094558 RepID=A0A314ZJZ3_PRUYE|nr:pentatricopeptide repeat-containing protein [Prunus yedoensis var. nudiflora]